MLDVWVEGEWVHETGVLDEALATAAQHSSSRDCDVEIRDDGDRLLAIVRVSVPEVGEARD